jgi:hypothetical protein
MIEKAVSARTWEAAMMDVATDLLNRVKQEYLEMPGLLLTARQAGRLWNLDASVCQALLSTLVHEKFLSQTLGGAYLRCGGESERSRVARTSQKHRFADRMMMATKSRRWTIPR